ncbi:MAG: hypothetical protein K6U14_04165 [Firmicutes bacterium]|nr:hypothetical protein [Alicyclobacillaceae bacterium]MCL6496816.1 hypothetical protein [Bacillota bacterium]
MASTAKGRIPAARPSSALVPRNTTGTPKLAAQNPYLRRVAIPLSSASHKSRTRW